MADTNKTTEQWNSVQAYTLAVICLLVGIAGGWIIRGSRTTAANPVEAASENTPGGGAGAGSQMPSQAQMKQMADAQAAPLLEKLKSDTNNPDLLANIGNVYYDTQQYTTAIDYYQRTLKLQPENTGVRTDLGTAYWYLGNADTAIEQFNEALKYDPSMSNTLFNLGIVKWQGKMDVEGAVTAWQKLLATNPTYEGKEKVQQLIAQARKHSNVKPGTPAKPLPQ